MADAESVEYVQKQGDFQVGDYVTIVVSQDANGDGKRHVNGIIAGEGTDQMNNVVSGTWNLEIPGWDSLHGKKDENGRPQGGHIYQVRPLACSNFRICLIIPLLQSTSINICCFFAFFFYIKHYSLF